MSYARQADLHQALEHLMRGRPALRAPHAHPYRRFRGDGFVLPAPSRPINSRATTLGVPAGPDAPRLMAHPVTLLAQVWYLGTL